MLIALIVIVVLVLLVGFVVVGFNKLRRTDIGAQEALGGIDVQLTRRADLIPNLVETVKGYAAHEQSVFEEVTAARAGVAAAAKGDDVPAKAAADAALQQALVRVNAVAENYPDLKANQNFLQLQAQLAETENQISFARQYYNDAVASLNKLVVTIPWMLLVGMAGVRTREFYEAPAGSDVAPKVDFGTSAPPVAPPVTPAAPAVPPTAPPPALEPPAGASEEPQAGS
jgi:LemA protein